MSDGTPTEIEALRSARRGFLLAEGREPSVEELGEKLGVTSGEIERLLEAEAAAALGSGWRPLHKHPDADPDCDRCHGYGKVDIGRGVVNPLCPCVRERLRRRNATELLGLLLSRGSEHMRLDSYRTVDAQGAACPQNELALRTARNFVHYFDQASEEGWVLGFYGPPGSGKTHLAVGIGAEVCLERSSPDGRLLRPAFLNVAKMLQAERARFGNRKKGTEQPASPIERARSADIVILDDLAAAYEKVGDGQGPTWVQEQLYILIDDCVMNNTPLIYTMNLTPAQLNQMMGGNELDEGQLADPGQLGGSRIISRLRRKEVEGSPIEVPTVAGADRQAASAADLLFGPTPTS